jgi:hypothetical protein
LAATQSINQQDSGGVFVTEIERYVESVLSGLPLEDDEKSEMKEELSAHLNEHIHELMIKGYSEGDASCQAIQAFGNERKINLEMNKALFPYYKVARYLWNVVVVTFFLCLLSYSVTEFYHPEFENSLPLYSVGMGMFLVALLAGVAEVMYEAVNDLFKLKWLKNPWLFFFIPSLIIGIFTSFSLLEHPEQYQDGLWIDLYVIPISALMYLISRELFTLIFVKKKANKIT